MYRSILVPFDGSEHARRALEIALRLQSGKQPTLHLLHVVAPSAGDTELSLVMGAAASEELGRRAREKGRRLLEDAVETLGELAERVDCHVRSGPCAQTIVEQARDLGVGAIVMGSRGLSDLKGLAIGSVSHKVMHIAECEVVTVHATP